MSDVLLLYLFTRVDVLLHFLGFVVGCSVFVIAFSCVVRYLDSFVEGEWPPFFRPAVAVFCVSVALIVVVPNQKSLAFIIGGKVLVDAARSPETQEIGGLLLDRVKDVLREKE